MRSTPVIPAVLLLPMAIWAVADDAYETPPFELVASEFLPEGLLAGDHHRVVDRVVNDGYMNSYQIESDFGSFEAEGTALLQRRVSEIGALAQLAEISRSEAFQDALKKSATRQYRAAKQVIDEPVKTAKGIPGGVSRFVKRTSRQVKDFSAEVNEEYKEFKSERAEKKAWKAEAEAEGAAGDSDQSAEGWWEEEGAELTKDGAEWAEDYAKEWSGYTKNRRLLAGELGVDPYSDNEVLNKELYRVSQAAALGGFAMRFAPIPKVEVLGYMGDANDLVWRMHPLDLRMRNEKLLFEMGVSEETVAALYDNRSHSPSLITVMVNALMALEDVKGRAAWVEQVVTAESPAEAAFHVRGINFYAAYHQGRNPLSRVVNGAFSPQGVTADGRLVFAVPMDYVHWTEELAMLVERRMPEIRAASGAVKFEAWIEGGVSDLAREELEAIGFEIYERSFLGLEVDFPEG